MGVWNLRDQRRFLQGSKHRAGYFTEASRTGDSSTWGIEAALTKRQSNKAFTTLNPFTNNNGGIVYGFEADTGQYPNPYSSARTLTAASRANLGDRYIKLGGEASPGASNTMEYCQISTTGNFADFGDLTAARTEGGGCGTNFVTAVLMGGGSSTDTIEFFTMATLGNATDFGDMQGNTATASLTIASSVTRAFNVNGTVTPTDIRSVSIASKGNAEHWSDLNTGGIRNYTGSSSSTRGVVTGGYPGPSNVIDEFSVIHQGVVADFGNLIRAKDYCGNASSGTRCLAMGANQHPSDSLAEIDTFLYATRGNASDFGDLSSTRSSPGGGSNGVKFVAAGGMTRISSSNAIRDTVDIGTFASTGSVSDFGDLTVGTHYNIGASQGGGHLQDYLAHQSVPEGLFETQYSTSDTALIGPGDGGHFFVDSFSITTLGDATDFGDCAFQYRIGGANSSASRGFFVGGYDNSGNGIDSIECLAYHSKGRGAFWGDLTYSAAYNEGGAGNASRALTNQSVTIDYFNPATEGNASDFGDLSVTRGTAGLSSNDTRALFWAGSPGSASQMVNVVDYVTIASTGDASDFGDCTKCTNKIGTASTVRSVHGGGNNYPAGNVNIIEYVTIASTGDTTDFGDLTAARTDHDACSNAVRAVWVMGNGNVATMDYVTMASTGNAADFGDVQRARRNASATSNSHAGLRSSS